MFLLFYLFLFLVIPDIHASQLGMDFQIQERRNFFVEYFLANRGYQDSSDSSNVVQEKFFHRAERDLRKKILKDLQKQGVFIKSWDFLDSAIFSGVKNSYIHIDSSEVVQNVEVNKSVFRVNWDVNWSGVIQEIQSWLVKEQFPKSMPKVLIMVGREGPQFVLDPLSRKLKNIMVDLCLFRGIPVIDEKKVHDFLSKNPFRASTAYGLRPEQLAEIGLKLHSDLIIRMSVSTKNYKNKESEIALRTQIHRTKNVIAILSERVVKKIPLQESLKEIPLDISFSQYFSKQFPNWIAYTLCTWQKILQEGIQYELFLTNIKDKEQLLPWINQIKQSKRVKSISIKSHRNNFLVVSVLYSGVFTELQELILENAKEFGLTLVRYESKLEQFFLRKKI